MTIYPSRVPCPGWTGRAPRDNLPLSGTMSRTDWESASSQSTPLGYHVQDGLGECLVTIYPSRVPCPGRTGRAPRHNLPLSGTMSRTDWESASSQSTPLRYHVQDGLGERLVTIYPSRVPCPGRTGRVPRHNLPLSGTMSRTDWESASSQSTPLGYHVQDGLGERLVTIYPSRVPCPGRTGRAPRDNLPLSGTMSRTDWESASSQSTPLRYHVQDGLGERLVTIYPSRVPCPGRTGRAPRHNLPLSGTMSRTDWESASSQSTPLGYHIQDGLGERLVTIYPSRQFVVNHVKGTNHKRPLPYNYVELL